MYEERFAEKENSIPFEPFLVMQLTGSLLKVNSITSIVAPRHLHFISIYFDMKWRYFYANDKPSGPLSRPI